MGEPEVSWDTMLLSLRNVADSVTKVDVPQCMIPGMSKSTPAQLDTMHQAIKIAVWLPELSVAMSGHSRSAQTKPAKDARTVLYRPDFKEPFQPVETKTTQDNLRAILSTTDDNDGKICKEPWTTKPGVIRNMLSPAGLTTMAFFGHEIVGPLIDFAFLFAKSKNAWGRAFLDSPVEVDRLDFAGAPERVKNVCEMADTRAPSDAVHYFAAKIVEEVVPAIEATYNAFTKRNFCVAAVARAFHPVDLSEVVQCEAVQCRDCSNSAIQQVQPLLPTESILKDTTPVFDDDPSSSWFKTADYAFKDVRMPLAAITRGDPKAELYWHKYQCDVLYARTSCPKLSERQVIQHLLSKGSREDMHFQTARAASIQPKITVKRFLETIREYYFTGGQFRLNIEDAWRRFDIETALNFNELIHFVKTHYQLIFIDYAHMAGKQSKLEFAILTFQKILSINKPSDRSALSQALHDFLPRNQLIEQFDKNLKPAMQECTTNANEVADTFIEWLTTKLVAARDSANTIKRCMDPVAHDDIDYARVRRKPRHKADNRDNNRHDNFLAAAASNRNDNMQRPGNARPGRQSTGQIPWYGPAKGQRVEGLMDALNTGDLSKLLNVAETVRTTPEIAAEMKTALRLEINGGVGSLAELWSHAAQLPPGIKDASQATMLSVLLDTYLRRKQKTCDGCRGTCDAHPGHALVNCKFARRHIPPERFDAFVAAHPFNAQRRFGPIPPDWRAPEKDPHCAITSTNPTANHNYKPGKRGRYDSNNKHHGRKHQRQDNRQSNNFIN